MRVPSSAQNEQRNFLLLFSLLTLLFFLKGLVRISVIQMLLCLVFMTATLAVFYAYSQQRSQALQRVAQSALILAVFTASWSALKQIRVLYVNHDSVLQQLLQRAQSDSLYSACPWCGASRVLPVKLCLQLDPEYRDTISYIANHTAPSEPIYVGLDRHDRIFANDMLAYFLANRLPATHWAELDPNLETRADIQAKMISELEAQKVRYILLESQFDSVAESYNDSSQSSGVHALDDYIRSNYHQVQSRGTLSLWFRNGAPA
jgi:hypothetical protein